MAKVNLFCKILALGTILEFWFHSILECTFTTNGYLYAILAIYDMTFSIAQPRKVLQQQKQNKQIPLLVMRLTRDSSVCYITTFLNRNFSHRPAV